MSWWVAFALTQAVEVPIYLLGTRGTELSVPWRLAIAFGTSAVTHPIVWFVLVGLREPLGYWGYVAVAEAFAVGVEAIYLRAFGVPRAGWLALGANAASVSVGLLWWWWAG